MKIREVWLIGMEMGIGMMMAFAFGIDPGFQIPIRHCIHPN